MQNKSTHFGSLCKALGTDINYVVLENIYNELKDKVDFYFNTPVRTIEKITNGYKVICDNGEYSCKKCIVSVGRSGSKWMQHICESLDIHTKSNRVDLGVRVELPAPIFDHITDELYEGKIVYQTENLRTL